MIVCKPRAALSQGRFTQVAVRGEVERCLLDGDGPRAWDPSAKVARFKLRRAFGEDRGYRGRAGYRASRRYRASLIFGKKKKTFCSFFQIIIFSLICTTVCLLLLYVDDHFHRSQRNQRQHGSCNLFLPADEKVQDTSSKFHIFS